MKHLKTCVKVIGVLALVFVLSTAVFAQRLDGTLRGEVTDATGAVVPGAIVTATNTATSTAQSMTTTSSGTYVFPNMLVGTYSVIVEAKGFQKFTRQNIEVRSNQVVDSNFKLAVGAESTTVEVSSGGEVINTSSSQLSNTLEARAATDLPNPQAGGQVLQLALLAPGVVSQGGGVLGEGGSVGGVRPRANGFNVDGADNNDVINTGVQSPVIQDAVADFTLVTNQFAAEYGHSAGGQYNVTTKSGSNTPHGESHWYLQNRNLNAADNLIGNQLAAGLIDKKPRFDHNRLGASLGGPIVKDKVFFFGAYEYATTGQLFTGPTITTPTAAGVGMLNSIAGAQGFSAIQGVLAQYPTVTAGTRTMDVIDTAGALGAPGGTIAIPVGDIQTFASNFNSRHSFQTNLDVNLGRHSVRTRFLFDRLRAVDLNLDTPLSQFNGTVIQDNKKAIVSDVWAINSSWVNDLRMSYSRTVGPNLATPKTFANFGNYEVDTMSLNIGPDGNGPQSGGQNVYQLQDQVTYSRGAHTFKWGGEYRKWIAPSNFLPRSRGEFDYANLNEFVNDLVPTGFNGALRGAGSGFFANNQQAIYGFFQDDWKIRKNLTLNAGVRYEYTTYPIDANKQLLNQISNCPTCISVDTPNGLIFGKPKTDKNNWSPRFGFAFDPTGSGKWSIRGGAQLAYDVTPGNFVLLQLPPQLQSEQNPDSTCSGLSGTPPAFCSSYLAGGTGRGFLQSGGLFSINLPPTTQAAARDATQAIIVDQVQPKILTWSLGVQRELMKNTSLEVRYLGTHATSLPVQVRRNVQTAFRADPTLRALPVYFSNSEVPAAITSSSTLAGFEAAAGIRPFAAQGFNGNLTAFDPKGQSIYHGASVDLIHRFNHGLYLRANYNWAHAIDDATNELFSSRVNPRRPQDAQNISGDRGRSVLDIRHKMAISWVYDVPKLNLDSGFGRAFMNGWQVNGTWLIQSGQPVTPLAGNDVNGDGDSAGDRAVVNPRGTSLTGTGVNYVCNAGVGGATTIVSDPTTCGLGNNANIVGYVAQNSAARFVAAELGALSTAGRNSISTPGFNVVDLGIFKNTHITETSYVQLRIEMLNTLNHRNFSLNVPAVFQAQDPGNSLSTSYANVVSSNFLNNKQFSGGSRTIQLGLKFIF